MREVLINGVKIELSFIYERGWQGIKYLVGYDCANEIEKDVDNFILTELGDGFVYKMSKRDLERCIKDGGSIRKINQSM